MPGMMRSLRFMEVRTLVNAEKLLANGCNYLIQYTSYTETPCKL